MARLVQPTDLRRLALATPDGQCAPGYLDEAMRTTNGQGVDAVGSLAYDDAHA